MALRLHLINRECTNPSVSVLLLAPRAPNPGRSNLYYSRRSFPTHLGRGASSTIALRAELLDFAELFAGSGVKLIERGDCHPDRYSRRGRGKCQVRNAVTHPPVERAVGIEWLSTPDDKRGRRAKDSRDEIPNFLE